MKKFNEKEFRDKVRADLEQSLSAQKNQTGADAEQLAQMDAFDIQTNVAFMKRVIKESVQETVYASMPDFIKCENHIGEIEWLTPLELQNSYEYFPIEKSWLQRFLSLFPKKKAVPLKLNDEMERFKKKYQKAVEEDAHKRYAEYQKEIKTLKRKTESNLKDRIHKEEIDKFYSAQKGYKKYVNHLGEERWLTKETLEQQEEFFEKTLSPHQRFIRKLGWGAFILFVISLGVMIWQMNAKDQYLRSYLLVHLNQEHGRLYLNQQLQVGFKPEVPYPIQSGEHNVALRYPGYSIRPKSQIITVKPGDTATVQFNVVKTNVSNGGKIIIEAEHLDARLYVDDEFFGTLERQKEFTLSEGLHTVILQKEGYVSVPPQYEIEVKKSETDTFSFRMTRQQKTTQSAATSSVGLVTVRSNVKNAEIYMDGKKTSYKTDYVLQKIPLGRHVISVKKEGYIVYPEERIVSLSRNHKNGRADFTLTSAAKRISIRTIPQKGNIYIDDKWVGTGRFKGSLPLGEHRIRFGEIPFYSTPLEKTFKIEKEGNDEFIFKYKSEFYLQFKTNATLPNANAGFNSKGYVLTGFDYRLSSQAGPAEVMNSEVNEKIWLLDYAFEYRNPPGSDALVINFNVPNEVNLSEPIRLKIWAYQTDINYPLVVNGDTNYRIIINNTRFRDLVVPQNHIKAIAENNYDRFVINNHLKRGNNKILIATTSETSAALAIWKIVIE
jgi:hypothetical protein